MVLGFSQRPSGEGTKLGVVGQKEGAGTKADPGVITQHARHSWEQGAEVRGSQVLQGQSRPGPSSSLTDFREPRVFVSPSETGTA